jgi:hypothetical protein
MQALYNPSAVQFHPNMSNELRSTPQMLSQRGVIQPTSPPVLAPGSQSTFSPVVQAAPVTLTSQPQVPIASQTVLPLVSSRPQTPNAGTSQSQPATVLYKPVPVYGIHLSEMVLGQMSPSQSFSTLQPVDTATGHVVAPHVPQSTVCMSPVPTSTQAPPGQIHAVGTILHPAVSQPLPGTATPPILAPQVRCNAWFALSYIPLSTTPCLSSNAMLHECFSHFIIIYLSPLEC